MKTSPRIGLTMKNAKGINRERRLFFQAGTECDFTFELRRRSLHLAGDHAKANDEIERRQRGKDPRTVKAHRKTGLAQEHADVDRVARVKRYGPFSTIAVSSTVARQKEALTAPVGASDRVPQSRSRQGPPPHARGIARRHRARTRRHPEPRAPR